LFFLVVTIYCKVCYAQEINLGSPNPGSEERTSPTLIETLLQDVRDGGKSLEEAAFYALLRSADQAGDVSGLDAIHVTRSELLATPNEFRGKLVTIGLRFLESSRTQAGDREAWPDPLFAIYGLDKETQQPVQGILIDDPDSTGAGGPLVLTGVFYKIRRERARVGVDDVELPVIIAKALQSSRGTSNETPLSAVSISILAGLIVVYFLLRRLSRHSVGRDRIPRTRSVDLSTVDELGGETNIDQTKDPAAALDALARSAASTASQDAPKDDS
jgi:hypothetical protein